ncbi:MAG TPA: sigma 54-interacting transcriptional regulator [bacterium]
MFAAYYTFDDIIGLDAVKSKARKLATLDVNVLIFGESGTGKELFAHAIHGGSRRAGGRFVAVNCGAVPETLFESELFGYQQGAFTDARKNYQGKIAHAHGGTMFFDEVGDLPLESQGKLLRVLETKKICPLGSNEERAVDVRFIFATNRDLKEMVGGKQFREDLYYRINTPVIVIPPLRDRRYEIPDLVQYFMQKLLDSPVKFTAGISSEAVKKLSEYDFPGNVRELEAVLRTAYFMCAGDVIEARDLVIESRQDDCSNGHHYIGSFDNNGNGSNGGRFIPLSLSFNEKVDRFKIKLIQECLRKHDDDVKKACAELGISERQVYRYLRKAKKR